MAAKEHGVLEEVWREMDLDEDVYLELVNHLNRYWRRSVQYEESNQTETHSAFQSPAG